MSFLAPLFLAAIGAVSLPILLHLIRRTPRGRVLFSSLMFLSSSPPRVTKRSRLEHWLLLLLRALAVILIALAFARPFLWEHATAEAEQIGAARRIAVLVDTSASMRRDDLWPQARAAVEAAVAEAGPTDAVSLMAFDRSMRREVTLQQWSAAPPAQRAALVNEAMSKLEAGWGRSKLGDALIAAAESLSESDAGGGQPLSGERIIVLVTDLQEGSDLKALDAYDWPAEVKVKLSRVEPKATTNAGLQMIVDRDAAAADARGGLRLRVSNAKDSGREQFTLKFDSAQIGDTATAAAVPKPIEVYVPPGESRVVRTGDLSAWWAAAGNTVTLEGDDHPFDNRIYHSATQPAEAVVVYLGGDDAKDTKGLRYYLDRAFPPMDELVTKIVALPAEKPLPPGETEGASLFVIGAAVPADRVNSLRRRAEDGATLLVVLRDAEMGGTAAAIAGVKGLTVKEAAARDYAILSEIDFKHPLFAPFADPRFGDFTKIRFWKHRAIDPPADASARTIAKFDDGSPAIIEAPVGRGRCLIMAAGWHPADGQLALSSKFVPLMNVLLQQSLGRPAAAARYEAGDAIDLGWLVHAPAHRGKPVKVTGPRGGPVALGADQRVTATDVPGIYTVTVGDATLHVAVNLAASESDTAPLPPEELEKRGVKLWQATAHLAAGEADRRRQMRMNELENKHKLWRWLIVAAIGVLMIETFVAGRFARPVNQEPDSPPS